MNCHLGNGMGVKLFILFSAHFLCVNIFQGEGVLLMNCFLKEVGVNPGKQTVYHMCKTWLQKVHGGWDTGGDF